jgi:DNA-binding winged helix-turn-helix (wHTH) protein/class 3 adenylate cyclase/tetratricopeptide (TPR) repeat protein
VAPSLHWYFAPFRLDPPTGCLWRGDQAIALTLKAFGVLHYLVTHPGVVVTKESLLEAVWPETAVSDGALRVVITELRKALGDPAHAPQFIATVHRRGYRFLAPVIQRVLPADRPDASGLAASDRPTLAAEPPGPPLAASYTPAPCPQEETPHGSAPALGLPLVVPQSSTAGARKLVTVLAGVLSLPPMGPQEGTLDDLHRLMQEVHTRLLHDVERYDGLLQHVTDDGFLAVFGAPVAQEDHAYRGVLTALALQRWLDTALRPRQGPAGGAPLALRLALHTGLVVVGPLGDDARRTAVVGRTTTLAGALARQAAPGTIVASEAMLRLVRAEVEAVPLPPCRLEGLSLPIPCYEVRGRRPRPLRRAALAERPRSPFVGRDAELALLQARLARVEQGQGVVVGIVGDPGLGKSRLLAEFQQALGASRVTALHGQCRSYGRAIPYLPLTEILRTCWEITETEREATILAKVQAGLQAVDLAPDRWAPYFLPLLGIGAEPEGLAGVSPEVLRERTFEALHQYFFASSQQRPCVFEIENLHWIDATSEAYLAALVERLAGVPILLLVTFRPGYQSGWLDKSYATQIALQPLGPAESQQVMHAIVHRTPLPVALEQQILAKAEGNPFFLEELAQAVVQQGGTTPVYAVPNTIQAVLAARIDCLPPAERRLLQAAAVIGTEVPFGLLQAVAEESEAALRQHLVHLQATEFLYETHLVPERKYTFKHVLTQEVAYDSLLREQRCALHATLINAIEHLSADGGADQVERLAHHALQGEIWDKAVVYFRQAGAKAVARSANQEAVACFEQALAALRQFPQSHATSELAIELRFDLRNALTLLGELGSMLDHLREAEALAEALGDQQRQGWVAAYMTQYCSIAGEQHRAIAAGQRALAIARDRDDLSLRVTTQFFLGLAYHALGNYPQAMTYLRKNVAELDGDLVREHLGMANLPAVISRTWLAWCLAECGAFAEGLTRAKEGMGIAEAVAHPASLIQAYCGVGSLCLRQGDLEEAMAVLERGLELCQGWNIRSRVPWMASFLGTAYALCGRLAEALPLLEQAVAQNAALRSLRYHALWVAGLSAGYLRVGRLEDARALADRALELSRVQKERGNEAYALQLLGDIAAHGEPRHVPQAVGYYRQAHALAQQLGMRPLQAHCYHGLGTLYAKTGQRQQAQAELSAAIAWYRAMDMPFWLSQAEAVLAQGNC